MHCSTLFVRASLAIGSARAATLTINNIDFEVEVFIMISLSGENFVEKNRGLL